MSEVLNEKCAVGAIVSNEQDVAPDMYEMLYGMQHRGSEASGIAAQHRGKIYAHGGEGMVRDVYRQEDMDRLAGSVAIGHNRYSTNGSKGEHIQPILDKNKGFAFAHNGNLPVTDLLERDLHKQGYLLSNMNDSEMMAISIAERIRPGTDLSEAVAQAYDLFRGSFSCVAMCDGVVVAFRDRKGIRPLAIGETVSGDYAIASETCALDKIDAKYTREVEPGEMVVIENGRMTSRQIVEGDDKLDMFEFVYFARPDSYLYNKRVSGVRYNFGKKLAQEHPPSDENLDNTIVVPVPDTSIPAAEGYAKALGLTVRQALIKDRYTTARTFMQPTDSGRKTQLRRKHNIISEAISGRDVILIDDSIVRFNTMPRLVEQTEAAGAKSVTVLVASPPVRFPDYYGIDTPSQAELVAANLTTEQIRERMGADYLGYLSLSGMVESTGISYDKFNLSCFNGEYPIGIGRRKEEIRVPVSMEYAE